MKGLRINRETARVKFVVDSLGVIQATEIDKGQSGACKYFNGIYTNSSYPYKTLTAPSSAYLDSISHIEDSKRRIYKVVNNEVKLRSVAELEANPMGNL